MQIMCLIMQENVYNKFYSVCNGTKTIYIKIYFIIFSETSSQKIFC